MKATTVKIEGELLEQIKAAKPPGRSVSAYVRHVVKKDLERRKMRSAATAFKAFVKAHPEERAWLAEWDSADLASTPAPPRGTSAPSCQAKP